MGRLNVNAPRGVAPSLTFASGEFCATASITSIDVHAALGRQASPQLQWQSRPPSSRQPARPLDVSAPGGTGRRVLVPAIGADAQRQAAVLRLEEDIRQAVTGKSDNQTSEVRFLRKAFTRFDKNKDDTVDFGEFCSVLECFGLHCADRDDLRGGVDPAVASMLFKRYDFDGNGTVSYRQFAAALFSLPGAADPKPLHPGARWYH